MDLSIIIPHRNRKALLEKCLASIPAAATTLSYEVIVIDNGSKDGSREMIQRHFPDFSLLENEKNEGFSRATNQGLQVAQGNYLLCINNDTTLSPNSLKQLVSFMETHPEAGVSGGKIFNPDGSIQPSARAFPRLENALFNRSSFLSQLFPKNRFSRRYLLSDWNHETVREVDWISGSFFLIRRALLEKIGLFDERFFLYCEDVDYCLRAKEAGYHVFYVPEARMIHATRYSERTFDTLFHHHQSMHRFYKKHYSRHRLWDVVVLGGVTCRFLTGLTFLTGRKLFSRGKNGASP